jgi:hypothetical protein
MIFLIIYIFYIDYIHLIIFILISGISLIITRIKPIKFSPKYPWSKVIKEILIVSCEIQNESERIQKILIISGDRKPEKS